MHLPSSQRTFPKNDTGAMVKLFFLLFLVYFDKLFQLHPNSNNPNLEKENYILNSGAAKSYFLHLCTMH